MTVTLKLIPRDPIVARDGRPFGADSGTRMKSLGWPLPSTIAGAIRTKVGEAYGRGFQPEVIKALLRLRITGAFPVCDSQVFLPAPHDALQSRSGTCVTLRPDLSGIGNTDLPQGLAPVLTDINVALEKFADPPTWWSADKLAEWLILPGDAIPEFFQSPADFLSSATVENRTHVEIDPDKYSAKDGRLFSTAGLVVDRLPVATGDGSMAIELLVFVERCLATDTDNAFATILQQLGGLHPLGGERRLVRLQPTASASIFNAPDPNLLAKTRHPLVAGSRLRLVLATPAVFSHGWLPGWLEKQTDGSYRGTPPPLSGTRCVLKLRSVSILRWDAVSGWSYEHGKPKPLKRMVPAGGVYYFDVTEAGSLSRQSIADVITTLWMRSVSDDRQDQNDGFGTAVWGTWTPR